MQRQQAGGQGMELAGQIFALIMIAVPLIVAAAMIVWRMHGRRQKIYLLVLALFPLLLMASLLMLGAIFSPSHDSGFSNLAFGVMLIGIFAVVPWMAACTLGFFLGALLRRSYPPPEPVPAETPAAAETGAPLTPALSRPEPALVPPDRPQPAHQEFSPDGSIRVDIQPVEWAQGQFAATPRVVRASDGQVLCDLLGSDWDAHVAYPREAYVWLGLRRYRAPGHMFVEFDLAADRYAIALNALEEPDEAGALGDVTDRLEAWWEKASATALYRADKEHPVSVGPVGRFAAWRSALVILVGAIVAIVVLTWISVKYDVDPPRIPGSVPHIPRFPH